MADFREIRNLDIENYAKTGATSKEIKLLLDKQNGIKLR